MVKLLNRVRAERELLKVDAMQGAPVLPGTFDPRRLYCPAPPASGPALPPNVELRADREPNARREPHFPSCPHRMMSIVHTSSL
eukprot:3480317-Prymnesium_polylepis.1